MKPIALLSTLVVLSFGAPALAAGSGDHGGHGPDCPDHFTVAAGNGGDHGGHGPDCPEHFTLSAGNGGDHGGHGPDCPDHFTA